LVAPTISHVICTTALILLIFVMQFSYFYVVDNISAQMARRELKEIADYVSDTLANLYFLANSTNRDVILQKTLDMPSAVRDATYLVEIVFNETLLAQNVHAYIKDNSRIDTTSWLLPGLRVDDSQYEPVECGGKTPIAGCRRNSTGVYVWIAYEV